MSGTASGAVVAKRRWPDRNQNQSESAKREKPDCGAIESALNKRNTMNINPKTPTMRGTLAALLLAMSVATAIAGPRTSTNYSVPTDTADAGGNRTTSAAYTHDGSAGGIVGISTVAAPAETAKSGYVGQLYDVTGLTPTAATTNVNEGATLQLGAWQALDDSTFLAVPAASVAWSTVNGPLSISSGGLATAGAVYQNTSATAQGIALGFTGTLGLTVVNTLPDNFGTYAADGITDAWQVQYFGEGNALAAPGVDADGDGQNNLTEFRAGYIPTNASSRFTTRALSLSGSTFTLELSRVQPTCPPRIVPHRTLADGMTASSVSAFPISD